MAKIKINITYILSDDRFIISNTKFPTKIIEEFLRTQIGKGEDFSPANKVDEFTISILLDLSHDIFTVKHNCGNKGLRDGILQRYITKCGK